MNMKKLFSTVSTVVFLSAASLLSQNAMAGDQDIVDTMEKSRTSATIAAAEFEKEIPGIMLRVLTQGKIAKGPFKGKPLSELARFDYTDGSVFASSSYATKDFTVTTVASQVVDRSDIETLTASVFLKQTTPDVYSVQLAFRIPGVTAETTLEIPFAALKPLCLGFLGVSMHEAGKELLVDLEAVVRPKYVQDLVTKMFTMQKAVTVAEGEKKVAATQLAALQTSFDAMKLDLEGKLIAATSSGSTAATELAKLKGDFDLERKALEAKVAASTSSESALSGELAKLKSDFDVERKALEAKLLTSTTSESTLTAELAKLRVDFDAEKKALEAKVAASTASGSSQLVALQSSLDAMKLELEGKLAAAMASGGSLTGQLATLQAELETEKAKASRLEGLKTESDGMISSMKSQISEHEGIVSSLQGQLSESQGQLGQLDELHGQVAALEARISELLQQSQSGASKSSDGKAKEIENFLMTNPGWGATYTTLEGILMKHNGEGWNVDQQEDSQPLQASYTS